MKQKRKYLVLSGAVLVAFLLLFFRFSAKNAHADQPQDASIPPVAVVRVKRGPMLNSLTLSGAFRPYQQVDVHAKVAGYIRHIYVDVGDKVKAGQVLAVLEVPELAAQILGSEA